jgi:hypothetical protein
MIDGRRLRRRDREYFGFYVRVEDPPNRLILHTLLSNYTKHQRPEAKT